MSGESWTIKKSYLWLHVVRFKSPYCALDCRGGGSRCGETDWKPRRCQALTFLSQSCFFPPLLWDLRFLSQSFSELQSPQRGLSPANLLTQRWRWPAAPCWRVRVLGEAWLLPSQTSLVTCGPVSGEAQGRGGCRLGGRASLRPRGI